MAWHKNNIRQKQAHRQPSIPRIFCNSVTNILFTNGTALLKICDNLIFIHKDIFTLEKNTKLPPSDLIHLIAHLEFPLRATSEPTGH